MSIARFRGTCMHCGHDHDADNEVFKAALATRSESGATQEEVKLILQRACDRDWKDETLYQTAVIAANAIYWRDREIEALKKGTPK